MATVRNTTFGQNSASSAGGGLYNDHSLTLQFSTVTHNSAPPGEGGGIFNDGTVGLNRQHDPSNLTNNCSPAMLGHRLHRLIPGTG